MKIGFDGTGVRSAGGIAHISELLSASKPIEHGFDRVILWGEEKLLGSVQDADWLDKRVLWDGGGLVGRYAHQREIARQFRCENGTVLLCLGGTFAGSFAPMVTLAQNLLPFDTGARRLKGWSLLQRVRLHLLEGAQRWTFRKSAGLIFLSEISRVHIECRLGFRRPATTVHHGVSPRFFSSSCRETLSMSQDVKLLYVSILDPYKHQSTVIDAVAAERKAGRRFTLDLAGPGHPKYQAEIRSRILARDPAQSYLRYLGAVAPAELPDLYSSADVFVFASSCEAFGLIVLEAMAAGLPVVCSNRSSLPEIAGDACIYFDPTNAQSLAEALRCVHDSPNLYRRLAAQAQARAREFTWVECARRTFDFAATVARIQGQRPV